MWFTAKDMGYIGKIDVSNGDIEKFSIPYEGDSGPEPAGIALGSDGNMWFTAIGSNSIGKITPEGIITEFDLPTPGANPALITLGSDGNMWFSEVISNLVGKITPSGEITEYPLPTEESFAIPITKGPDQNIWLSAGEKEMLIRITPSGEITEFPFPEIGGYFGAIATGPDGNLWVNSADGDFVVYKFTGIDQVAPPTNSSPDTTVVPSAPKTGLNPQIVILFTLSVVILLLGTKTLHRKITAVKS